MVILERAGNGAKKPVRRIAESTSHNLYDVSDIIRTKGQKSLCDLWREQRRYALEDGIETPYHDISVIERTAWLVSPERLTDMNISVMSAFKRCVDGQSTIKSDPALGSLPEDKAAMVFEALTRETNTRCKTGGRIIDPDQLAIAAHMTRLGFGLREQATIFRHPLIGHVQDAIRLTLNFKKPYSASNPKTWDFGKHPA